MKNFFLILLLFFFCTKALASNKQNIIKNLEVIDNISFNFEQSVNGKKENGKCTIQYPKKVNCKYNLKNQKVLISNGKSLVIKTITSYYLYPLEKTPLNLILDKKFLIKKIKNLEERIIENKFINFKFIENDNEINIFFDKKNFYLIGWQTLDVYQNLNITFLHSLKVNQKLKKDTFKLPKSN